MAVNPDETGDSKGKPVTAMAQRFRGFLPVVIDVETGGFDPTHNALLEIAAVLLSIDDDGHLTPTDTFRYHIKPFEGSRLDPASLEVTGIDVDHPLRPAIEERDALQRIFREVRRELRSQSCTRAILVGHNSFFDLQFLNAAVERTGIKRNPFHPFSSFDTATLSGVAVGQTVLARAVSAVGLSWDKQQAHSAAYDAEITAALFCKIVNRFRSIYETHLGPPSPT